MDPSVKSLLILGQTIKPDLETKESSFINISKNKYKLIIDVQKKSSLKDVSKFINNIKDRVFEKLSSSELVDVFKGMEDLKNRFLRFKTKHPFKFFLINLITLGSCGNSLNLFDISMNKIQSKQEVKLKIEQEEIKKVAEEKIQEKLKIEQEERKKVAEEKIQEKLKIEQEEKEKAQAQAQFIQNLSKEIEKFLKNRTEFKDCNFALNEEKKQLRVGDKELQFTIENTGIRCLGKVFKSFAELIQNSEMQEIIKNESMMTRREAFLIIKESELENPSVLKQWIVENNDDWVAHAVWTQDSVKKIFEAGKLSPAEEVLRNSKEVEYEQGNIYGQRGTTSLPTLDEEEIEKIKKLYKEITSDPNLDIDIEEETKSDGRKTFKFQLIISTKYFNFSSILREIAKKKSTHEHNIYLAFEKTLPLEERFDFVLSKKYEMIKAAYKTKIQFENIPQNHIKKTEKDIYSIFNTAIAGEA